MAGFRIKPDQVEAVAENLDGYSKRLEEIGENVGEVRRSEGISTRSYSSVQWRVKALSEKLEDEKKKMGSLYTALQSVNRQYIECEDRITGHGNGTTPETLPEPGDGKGEEGKKAWYSGIPQATLKAAFDAVTEAGNFGKEFSIVSAFAKILIDHDGLTPKDLGEIIKGMGNSAIGLMLDDNKTDVDSLKEAFGLKPFKTIEVDAAAGWLKNAGSTFKATLKDQLNPMKLDAATGAKVLDKAAVAGWSLSLVANGFNNYERASKGEISGGRAVAQTVVETGVDIAKGAAITAGVAAGIAALGISAPAVVVGGAAVAVSAILDYGSQQLFGKGVTQLVSDAVIDGAAAVGKGIQEAASAVGNAVKDTFTGAVKSIGNIMPKWKWSFG